MEGRLLLICVGLFSLSALGLAALILTKVFAPELHAAFAGIRL